jgi:hypothetical protein
MSIGDILIILGCLAGGYWIVNSVMGPGVDITARKEDPRESPGKSSAVKALPNPHQNDWYLVLDLARTASRAEIEAGYKRQLNKALAARDTVQQDKLRLAREAGLSSLRS